MIHSCVSWSSFILHLISVVDISIDNYFSCVYTALTIHPFIYRYKTEKGEKLEPIEEVTIEVFIDCLCHLLYLFFKESFMSFNSLLLFHFKGCG